MRSEHGSSLTALAGTETNVLPDGSLDYADEVLEELDWVIASVHSSIRRPDGDPPAKGGHLVLVYGQADGMLVFHNPSGHDRASREAVALPIETFDRFFAGRGIAILP